MPPVQAMYQFMRTPAIITNVLGEIVVSSIIKRVVRLRIAGTCVCVVGDTWVETLESNNV